MNYRLLSKYLGIIVMLIGGSMLLSLPWAFPAFGQTAEFETAGFWGLMASIAVSLALGLALYVPFRAEDSRLFTREAMVVVTLSWVLATFLGALPFLVAQVERAPGAPMDVADALFESAAGFTGCGATILSQLEVPKAVDESPPGPPLVPRCLLFWRSETHFLGGLGIMVLFVAVLGQGSAGKALMRAETPGPSKDTGATRVQYAAWSFAAIYLSLNVILTLLLILEGVSIFDALCHAFGTVATGGFSTFNDSVAHFRNQQYPWSYLIEMTIAVFMAISCVNFALLYLFVAGKFEALWKDIELRYYLAILLGATVAVMVVEMISGHQHFGTFAEAWRYSFFNVTSIMTNTGFANQNFDTWSHFSRATLLVLMFVGGCAGSTSCSIKVIRHVLLWKILYMEIERFFAPRVVRPLLLGDEVIRDPELPRKILVYFCTVLVVIVLAWQILVLIEPTSTWDNATQADCVGQNKLIDCASAVAATINGVGPGLGVVGATENYGKFTWASKLLYTFLMILGRLEIFVVLALFVPGFWRSRYSA